MLHEGTIPWRHVAISGWVLDPDRKKMSKSKGNVVTPMHLLDQYGADAVRYWSLSARLGTDTAFDEKVLKVGRRLVVKLFNAGQVRAAAGGRARGPDHPRAGPGLPGAAARDVAEAADGASTPSSYATALGLIERFFWSGFTDTYLELVKARCAPRGRRSRAAARRSRRLRLASATLLRLLAPFLPYVAEEVWSWRFGGRPEAAASTGRRGPAPRDFAGLPAVDGDGARVRAPRWPSWRP